MSIKSDITDNVLHEWVKYVDATEIIVGVIREKPSHC